VFGAFTALMVTIGALVLSLRLLRRLHSGRSGRPGALLEVLQRVSTGPKQGVVLLRAGARVLVVGVGDSHTTLLGELDAEARDEALRAEAAMPARTIRPSIPNWKSIWSRAALLLALVLVPAVSAGAQEVTSPKPAASRAAAGAAAAPSRGLSVAPPVGPRVEVRMGDGTNDLKLSGAVGVAVFLGFLTLLPAIFLLTTSFTRILVVLHFLRNAIGTQTAPPTQLLVAISVLLTGVIMGPVFQQTNREAIQPYLRGEITQTQAYEKGVVPLRQFMLANTRTQDLATFAEIARADSASSLEELPTTTVIAAFVTSELRTAFQMGFVIFLPFLVIDLVVSSVLMSMGMFMLPPVMVSLPFKLLLFVLADGWSLVIQSLVSSFRV
jgi:flagellar biosynthesis protein FliP